MRFTQKDGREAAVPETIRQTSFIAAGISNKTDPIVVGIGMVFVYQDKDEEGE